MRRRWARRLLRQRAARGRAAAAAASTWHHCGRCSAAVAEGQAILAAAAACSCLGRYRPCGAPQTWMNPRLAQTLGCVCLCGMSLQHHGGSPGPCRHSRQSQAAAAAGSAFVCHRRAPHPCACPRLSWSLDARTQMGGGEAQGDIITTIQAWMRPRCSASPGHQVRLSEPGEAGVRLFRPTVMVAAQQQ